MVNQLILDILQYLVGLFGRIVAVDVPRVIQALGALAAHPHGFSTLRDDSLAKVVVEILFGICVTGIELANAVMRHGPVLDWSCISCRSLCPMSVPASMRLARAGFCRMG